MSGRAGAFLVRRVLQAVPLIAAIVTLTFILIHAAPGDPVYMVAGDGGDAAYYAAMRARYGLDRPIAEQYAAYVKGVLSGDFGFSYGYQQPVFEVIRDRMPATLLLCGSSLLLAAVAGLLLGLWAARTPEGPADIMVRTVTSVGAAMPMFWTGQLLLLAFAVAIPLFPVGGVVSIRDGWGWRPVDLAWHLVLPATALSIGLVAMIARMTRAGLIVEMRHEYVRAARGRGLSSDAALTHHALPNALLPVLTIVGNDTGALLTGAALTEALFGWPGIGQLLLEASAQRDYPLIIAVLLTASLLVVAANVVTDVCYTVLDPRVEL